MSRTILVEEGNEITRIGIVANSSTAQRRKNRENRLVTKTLTVRVLRNQCRREVVRSTALRIFDLHFIIDRNRFPRRIAINVSGDFRNCFKYRRKRVAILSDFKAELSKITRVSQSRRSKDFPSIPSGERTRD